MARAPAHIFREYDIRGLVDPDLSVEVVELLGRALGSLTKRANLQGTPAGTPAVAVGRDARESSVRFRDALARGITAAGCDVVDVGLVPTPLVYFAANTLPVHALAMITGSHNPPEFNGFKMGLGKSTFHGAELQALREMIERDDFTSGQGTVRQVDIVEPYLTFVQKNLKLGARRPKLVLDAGNGVGGFVAAPLFQRLGFDVTGMYLEPDGNFPNHHPDPTVEKNMVDLQAKVLAQGADLGIAYDGDADRLGVVDEKGQLIWGDKLTILLARAVLAEVPGAAILGEVKCSKTLFDDIEKHGGKAIMWKAGHSLIKAKMLETHAELAGEMSGHIFFKHRYFGFDDGIYASARLVELLTHTDRPLSTLLSDVPETFSTPELRHETTEARKFALVEAVKRRFSDPKFETVTIDGLRLVFPDGWGLVRASNTQPLLILRFEAESPARLTEIRALVENAVTEAEAQLGA